MPNIHASCVDYFDKGILILGPSGAGKSDICLRLIMNHHAKLVADDRVDLRVFNGEIMASAPENIRDMLEVRGVGILKMPAVESVYIKLVVQLVSQDEKLERLPKSEFYEVKEIKIPLIKLHAYEDSTPDKIIARLNYELKN